jgi:GNAT superfamily N-acetyltransferase
VATRRPALRVKVASEPWELEQVYRLTYQTFVEEIPQHAPNPEGLLVDPRIARSTCFIALAAERLCGMVLLGAERPFSLDAKVPGLDSYLPAHRRPCEIRLLSIPPGDRGGRIFAALMQELLRHARQEGHDLGLISATDRQEKLYRHLGGVPFGPPLGTETARYQGMYLTWDRLPGSLLGSLETPR